MSDDTRPVFLYKLEAACGDVPGSELNSLGPCVLREHFDYLKRLYERGDIVLFGLTLNQDSPAISLCVFRANSEEAARCIMENDPFIAKGVVRGALFPFHIALQEHSPT